MSNPSPINFRALLLIAGLSLISLNLFAQINQRTFFKASENFLCSPGCVNFTYPDSTKITSWSWEFPGGTPSTSTVPNPYVCYSAEGSYGVHLTFTDSAGGRTLFATNFITVGLHAGTITTAHDTVCVGQFTILSLNARAPNYQWQSSYSGTDFVNVPVSLYYPNRLDTLFSQTTFIRAILSYSQCADTTPILKLVVMPASLNSFTDSINGLQVAFTGNTTLPSSNYSWNFGDGGSSTELSPVHTYAASGSYHACFNATPDNGCSAAPSCRDVSIGSSVHCEAYFTLYPDMLSPHHWWAIPHVKGKLPIQYAWQWGDGINGVGDTASHVYTSPGFYKICLNITDDSACTTTYCDSSLYLFRQEDANSMVKVSVVQSIPSGTLTVKPSPLHNLSVYPNPCNTCLVKGINNVNDVEIMDMLGQKINAFFTLTGNGYFVNLPTAQTGMFLLRNIRTGQVVKFVKE